MITELTQEQTDKLSVYVTEWTARGLTTTQRTLEDAQIDFGNFQVKVLKKTPPAPVSLYNSPKKCWDRVNAIYSAKEGREVKLKFVYPYFDCQFWAGWCSFYEFMKKEVGIQYTHNEEYEALIACVGYCMVFPLDEECIVCQPPTIIKKNNNGLHCVDGPALSYNGDNEIFALNGVVMDKKYIMTPAEYISAEMVMAETNVECRRELIRKIGLERLMSLMPHRLMDKRDHPTNTRPHKPSDVMDSSITAPNAERNCEAVRKVIRSQTLDHPEIQFDLAVQKQDWTTVATLFGQSWFGIPESTECWSIPGASIMVDLLDDPIDFDDSFLEPH